MAVGFWDSEGDLIPGKGPNHGFRKKTDYFLKGVRKAAGSMQ